MMNYWIFGSSKSLGNEVLRFMIADNHFVTSFSRSGAGIDGQFIRDIKVDFADRIKLDEIIKENLKLGIPDGVLFCQRYRPQTNDQVDAILEGTIVELAPVISFIKFLKGYSIPKKISVVLTSSIAGSMIHIDISLYYHILKSNAITLSNFISIHERKKVLINCIVIGEFLKYEIDQYKEAEMRKFNNLAEYTFDGKIVSKKEIAEFMKFLLSANKSNLTGQVFYLDGNVKNIAQESIIRQFP